MYRRRRATFFGGVIGAGVGEVGVGERVDSHVEMEFLETHLQSKLAVLRYRQGWSRGKLAVRSGGGEGEVGVDVRVRVHVREMELEP